MSVASTGASLPSISHPSLFLCFFVPLSAILFLSRPRGDFDKSFVLDEEEKTATSDHRDGHWRAREERFQIDGKDERTRKCAFPSLSLSLSELPSARPRDSPLARPRNLELRAGCSRLFSLLLCSREFAERERDRVGRRLCVCEGCLGRTFLILVLSVLTPMRNSLTSLPFPVTGSFEVCCARFAASLSVCNK